MRPRTVRTNIYACYKNGVGEWVVDGEKGRETYPLRFSKETIIACYREEFRTYQCGKYNITVYDRDIAYKNTLIALVCLDKFDNEDRPVGEKHFYLPQGKNLDLSLTEKDFDIIYTTKKTGSWL